MSRGNTTGTYKDLETSVTAKLGVRRMRLIVRASYINDNRPMHAVKAKAVSPL